jgi:hypothetical protein
MCIKTITIDTYPDGRTSAWEVVETCRPGSSHLCSHPRVKEVRRLINNSSPRLSTGIDFMRLPPSPRLTPSPRHSPRHSPTPSASGSDGHRRREHKSTLYTYVNGEKVYEQELGRRSSRIETAEPRHRHHHIRDHHVPIRTRDPRAVEVIQPAPRARYVPDAPVPRLSRSSTMPTRQEFVVIPERRTTANTSRRVVPPPLTTAPIPGLSRRASAAYPTQSHHQTTPTTPFILVDDERERADRRRRREERRASAHIAATSAAATAVQKELRWEDEQRAAQNARIAQRPAAVPKVYQQPQEPRGILKTPPASPRMDGYTRPAVEVVVPERERAGIRRSVTGLEIQEALEARRARREERELKDRLAARLNRGNASRVYYPGEGLYKYM